MLQRNNSGEAGHLAASGSPDHRAHTKSAPSRGLAAERTDDPLSFAEARPPKPAFAKPPMP
jgi:hypothetical protein